MASVSFCDASIGNRAIASLLAIGIGVAVAGAASAQQPTPGQQGAIKSACRGDYQAVCASVQPGGPAALHCLQENAAQVSPACRQALAAVGSAQASPAPSPMAGGAMAPAAAAPMMAAGGGMPPVSMRDEMRITRQACGKDYQTFCQGVQPGGGHAITCLEANAPSLTPGCRQALGAMKGRAGK